MGHKKSIAAGIRKYTTMGNGIRLFATILMIICIITGFIIVNANRDPTYCFVGALIMMPLRWFGELCLRVTDLQSSLNDIEEKLDSMISLNRKEKIIDSLPDQEPPESYYAPPANRRAGKEPPESYYAPPSRRLKDKEPPESYYAQSAEEYHRNQQKYR